MSEKFWEDTVVEHGGRVVIIVDISNLWSHLPIEMIKSGAKKIFWSFGTIQSPFYSVTSVDFGKEVSKKKVSLDYKYFQNGTILSQNQI